MTSSGSSTAQKTSHGPMPAWLVPLLAIPLRRWLEDPARLVLPLVRPGMNVLEIGPGTGFYSIPVAQAIGADGRLVCVELQAFVRARLEKKLRKLGLAQRCEVRSCSRDDSGLEGLESRTDLALAIHVLHEMPDPARAIQQMAKCLCPGGHLLILEPKGHCPTSLFQAEREWASQAGLVEVKENFQTKGFRALFQRQGLAAC